MLQLNKQILENYEQAIQNEWLETNGLGGWSGSSVIGCNTRRYHGLLVAATVPPAERMSLVSKLDETIITGHERFELGTNNYGQVISPKGYQYLSSFTKNLLPEFIYEAGGIKLKKTIAMVHGENTVVIIYEVLKANQSFTLELLPLLSVRNYHSLMHANDAINRHASFDNNIFKTKAYEGTPDIFIKIPGGNYHAGPQWFYNFNYRVEQYRGLDFIEDLFAQGKFNVEFNEGDTLGIIVSTEKLEERDAIELFQKEMTRREVLIKDVIDNETLQQLVLAADQFIVTRGEDLKTVIAGYHWFTDWGRDTMISLPGLCLSTGRYDDAKKIISSFAKVISMGMLPNRFQDNGKEPEYNNVDGTLWYFIAVYKYLQQTKDKEFVLNEILPVLKEIIDWHLRGTRYNIHVDEDGLLYAGEEGQQLTWMDARIGTWVVTPRMGKPVEIQALWYNALKVFSELLQLNNQENDALLVNIRAEKARQSFTGKFWYEEGNYLYDVIDPSGNPDNTIRPNQLFAISLPFELIAGEQAKAVLKIVEEQLYTPVGLKSLPKSDSHYIPVYGGDPWHRDSSYHEGTVWSWLLGPYVDAIMKVKGDEGKIDAQKVINDFKYHLNEGCIGSVSEIFDAEPPHHPRGCVAQAWGVAEILRIIKEYELYGSGEGN
ncbi:MAG TPA: amylo-alpha-1,6-glucosidase [Chitinophagaceae bacterium]|nr:amylo-alpha-1,6-glucosidase [Chitinophagaceae bacterium]